jgi:hypothetical protein
MSQADVLEFLKEHKDTWFNVALITCSIMKQNKIPNTQYRETSCKVRRSLIKLGWFDFIEGKTIGVDRFYKFKSKKCKLY